MKDYKIHIIILNWNRPQDTLECLESLKKMILKNLEVTVVLIDNGSTDDSVARFKKFPAGRLKLKIIEKTTNLGFTAGNNSGIDFSLKQGADFILLLNNDTTVDKNLLTELVLAADRNGDVDIFSPKIYFAKGFEFHKIYKESELGRVIWAFGGVIDWQNMYAHNKFVDQVDDGKFDNNFETDFATGAAMFLRSETLNKLNGFDENYYLYMEDVDLCERCKRAGGKILTVAKAIVWHKVSQSSGVGSELNDYYLTRNRLYFAKKFAPIRTQFALFRESLRFIVSGRLWQRRGVLDYLKGNLKIGSWKFAK